MTLRGTKVLVTGADGFIGSHLTERLVRGGRRRPRVLPLQLARLGRLARRDRPGDPRGPRHPPRRHPRRSLRGRRDRGRRGRLPPRRAHRDPVLVCRAPVVHRHQRVAARSTCSRRPGPPGSGASSRPRRARSTARPRSLPIRETHPLAAQSPYAASKVAADQLAMAFAELRAPRGHAAAVQHVRAAPVGPGGAADDAPPAARRPDGDPPRPPGPAPRPHVRRRHRGRVRPGRHRARHRWRGHPARHRSQRIDRRAVRDGLPAARRGGAGGGGPGPGPPRRERGPRPAVGPDARPRTPRLGRPARAWRTACARPSSGCAASPPRPTSIVPSSEGRIPLSEPSIGGNAAAYLQACLDTNFVSSVGPFVERFEREFAAAVGAAHAVACASGTAAFHLAFLVLDVGPGDDVLVADLTFVASANPIVYVGARPVLVDAEAATYNMDPALVVAELDRRAAAGERQPAAIEVVHLVGHPADIEPVLAAAGRYGIPVVEDASEALGRHVHPGRVRRPAGRHARADRRVQLQRQQAHHDRRRRDGRDRRRGPGPARSPPLDAGPAPWPGLRPRRGRLQLPAHEPGRGARGRAAGGARAAARGAPRDRRTVRRRDRHDRGPPAGAPRAPGPTRRSGSTRRPWRPRTPARRDRILAGARRLPASRPARSGGRSTRRAATRTPPGSAGPSPTGSSMRRSACRRRPA